MVLGKLVRLERTAESAIAADWEYGKVGMEQCLELLVGRMRVFGDLRQLLDCEDIGVDSNTTYTRAMVRLYLHWTARSILRLRSLTFVKLDARRVQDGKPATHTLVK
jgi:hypothetical protein